VEKVKNREREERGKSRGKGRGKGGRRDYRFFSNACALGNRYIKS